MEDLELGINPVTEIKLIIGDAIDEIDNETLDKAVKTLKMVGDKLFETKTFSRI